MPLYKELIKLFKERNCNFIISFYDKKSFRKFFQESQYSSITCIYPPYFSISKGMWRCFEGLLKYFGGVQGWGLSPPLFVAPFFPSPPIPAPYSTQIVVPTFNVNKSSIIRQSVLFTEDQGHICTCIKVTMENCLCLKITKYQSKNLG